MRITVDFPAPLGPRNPKISPLPTRKETRSTALKLPKFFVRPSTSTAHSLVGMFRHLCFAYARDKYVFERRRYGPQGRSSEAALLQGLAQRLGRGAFGC